MKGQKRREKFSTSIANAAGSPMDLGRRECCRWSGLVCRSANCDEILSALRNGWMSRWG